MFDQAKIDAILAEAERSEDPSTKVKLYIEAVEKTARYGAGDLALAKDMLRPVLELAEEHNIGIGEVYRISAILAFYSTDYKEAFVHADKAIAAFKEKDDIFGLAEMYAGLAMATWETGDYSEGLRLAFEGLKYHRQAGNWSRGNFSLYMIGSFYYDLEEYEQAKLYFQEGYEKAVEINAGKNFIARSLIGLGSVALAQKEYDKSWEYFAQAEELQLPINDLSGLGRTYNDKGKIRHQQGRWEEAESYFLKSLEMREGFSNSTALITTLTDCGHLYLDQGRLDEAEALLRRASSLAKEIKVKAKQSKVLKLLSEIYKAKEEWEKAFECFSRYHKLKDEVMGEDFNVKLRRVEQKTELERKEREAEIYRLRNVELKDAYERIEKKNRAITASINYAKRIQEAALPKLDQLNTFFSESFVLFQPRDIVSGDFYWFVEQKGKIFFAAVDCTGHGVPGAFMSMIGIDLLAQAVLLKGLSDPGEILDEMHTEVQLSLKQTDGINRDGMDMGLCVIDKEAGELLFSGAKNPLIVIKEGELEVVKADRQPIGGSALRKGRHPYTTHRLKLEAAAQYYMFSDGYQDQFGGSKGKKLTNRVFRDTLLKYSSAPMQSQKEKHESFLVEWIGNGQQIDDILLVGFKL